jgi:hypothetical protein
MTNEGLVVCQICGEEWNRHSIFHGEIPAWEVDLIIAGGGCRKCEENGSPYEAPTKPSDYIIGKCIGCERVISIDQDELFYDGENRINIPHTTEFVEETKFCTQCHSTKIIECYMCEKMFVEKDIELTSAITGRSYCKPCHKSHVEKCAGCENILEPGMLRTKDDNGSVFCDDCMHVNKTFVRCQTCYHIYSADVVHEGHCEKCLDEKE